MLKLIFLPLLTLGLVVSAADRGPRALMTPPDRGGTLDPVDCAALKRRDGLIAELDHLKGMAGDHHSAVNRFLNDITTRLQTWHKTWGDLEGKPGAVPLNTFSPLLQSADEIVEIQNEIIWKNLSSVEERFDAVMTCLEQQKAN